MTREEFFQGWVLLTVQPWGTRYADDSPSAKTQLGLYFDAFQSMDAAEWWRICRHLAGGERWPSLNRIREFCPTPHQHPGAEAAWARLAPSLNNEGLTVCWTDEMREAFGVAAGVKDNPVAARMAFKETYESLVQQAEMAGRQAAWSISLGWDANGREPVVQEAMRQGLIAPAYAQKFLPPPDDNGVLDITKRIGDR